MILWNYFGAIAGFWWYLLFTVFSVYLPGELFLTGFSKYTGWRRLALGSAIGIATFTIVSWTCAFFQIRAIVLPILILFAGVSLVRYKAWAHVLFKDWNAPHALLILLVFLFSLSVGTSGWLTDRGLELRGVNYQDGVWNVALATELREAFLPEHPSIAGVQLRGYHMLYNMWIGEMSRLSAIPLISLHFHYATLLMAVLFVYGVYAFALELTRSSRSALWSTFFAFLGGSVAFIIPVFFHIPVSIDDAFGITQPISLLVSPSYTASFILLLYGVLLLAEFVKKKSTRVGIGVAIVFGSIVGFKVYAGILAMVVFACVCLWSIVRYRRYDFFLWGLLALGVAAGVFFPVNASYGFLLYQPLWPPHRVMQGPLDFTKWELKRQTLVSMGSFWGLIRLEITALAIFFFGNMGTRLLGIVGFPQVWRKGKRQLIFWILIGMMGISFLLPLFFIQPIGTFNMIQFYWYFLVFAGVLAGWGISEALGRQARVSRIILFTVIVLCTLPSASDKLRAVFDFAPTIPPAQLALYQKLASIGMYGDTVLEMPSLPVYDKKSLDDWFNRSGPPFITMMGEKRSFIGKEVVQFPYEQWSEGRLALLAQVMIPQGKELVTTEDADRADDALRALQRTYTIHYIVTRGTGFVPWFARSPRVRQIFSNDAGSIYEMLPL